jgi:glucose-6-phosphate 1-dehydrogenase
VRQLRWRLTGSGLTGSILTMIKRLAVFGTTGDLTARYLLPGLASLLAAGQLGAGQ